MGSIAQDEQQGRKPSFPAEANTLEYAKSLDSKDPLRSFREKFIIPSKSNIKSKKLCKPGSSPVTPPHHMTNPSKNNPMINASTSVETLSVYNHGPCRNTWGSISIRGPRLVSMGILETSKDHLYRNGNSSPSKHQSHKLQSSVPLRPRSPRWGP